MTSNEPEGNDDDWLHRMAGGGMLTHITLKIQEPETSTNPDFVVL